jgi:tetratricopeptide (TPR) repeat protein
VKKSFLAVFLFLAAQANAESTDELNRRMMQLYTDGHYEEAIPLAAQVVTELEKSAGPASREVASALNNEAELYNKLHRYAEAEPLYKRSLAIRQQVLGPEHPDTVKSMNRLAELFHAEGKDILPAPPPQQRQTPPPRPMPQPQPVQPRGPSVQQQEFDKAIELNKQANELGSQGHYAEALPLATQALAIFEKVLPGDNANLGILVGNLARLQLELKDFAKAETSYKRAVAILEKQPASRPADLGLMYANIADLCERQQRHADAEAYYRKSLPLVEKGFGPDHENVAAVINNFAEIYRLQGKDPDSEPLLKGRWEKVAHFSLPKPRNITPEAPGAAVNPLDLDKSRQLDQKIYDLMEQKKFADALPVAQEQQALLEKMYGASNLAVAVNLDTLATIYRALGRGPEAEPLIKRSQTIRDGSRAVDQITR